MSLLKNWAIRGGAIFLSVGCLEINHGAVALPILAKPACESVGRVIKSSIFPTGKVVCRSDLLNNAKGSVTEFLCFVGLGLNLPTGWIALNKCLPPSSQIRVCGAESQVSCIKSKGGQDNSPILVRPYGSTLIDQRPVFSWSPVAKASSYTLEVKGKGVYWQKRLKDTILPYPQDQSALGFGQAYQIVIIANQGETPVSVGKFAVNLLQENQVAHIRGIVEQVKKLPLSSDEVAYLDLDSLYMSEGLLSASIETLVSRVEAGSRNPAIYRTLGDRYLEAGLPITAKRHYEKAVELAENVNSQEYTRAKTGLDRLDRYSQLPTKTNGAQ